MSGSNGKPHPVWRCERCGVWIPRDARRKIKTASDCPDCPSCSTGWNSRGTYYAGPAPMWPAFRVAPANYVQRVDKKKGRRALAQRP